MADEVLPQWAKDALIGRIVEAVTEDHPHTMVIKFTDGTPICLTAMPFDNGVLDVSAVEGLD
jgi:hypothetical protein